jgi:hypothetical protein
VHSTQVAGIRAGESHYERGREFDRQTGRNGRKSHKALKKRMMARNCLIGLTHKSGGGLQVAGRTWRTRLGIFPLKNDIQNRYFIHFAVVVENAYDAT